MMIRLRATKRYPIKIRFIRVTYPTCLAFGDSIMVDRVTGSLWNLDLSMGARHTDARGGNALESLGVTSCWEDLQFPECMLQQV